MHPPQRLETTYKIKGHLHMKVCALQGTNTELHFLHETQVA